MIFSALLGYAPGARADLRDLQIGFGDRIYGDAREERQQALDETERVNAEVVRLDANWSSIAPRFPSPDFDATDPLSPEYDWSKIDDQVIEADERGLRVMILVRKAPPWAEGENRPDSADPGTWRPNPQDLGDFGTAIASRFSGAYEGLPRVRDFLCWGEANLRTNLTPLWGGPGGKKPVVQDVYRPMLNHFYRAVHAVDDSNRVITAQTAPYGAKRGLFNVRPLLFWRKLLCVKDNKRLSPVKRCQPPMFDVLAHNPITTAGTPERSALNDDDVTTADLHNLIDVLRAAERAGNVLPLGRRPVWATEIWWESNPPDPAPGNPNLVRQARWYSLALHSLWRQGATMALLLQVRDTPYDGIPGREGENYQSGVFFERGVPKPAASAVAFPFVAKRRSPRKVMIWGKAPREGKLVVRAGKRKVTQIRVREGEVFQRVLRLRRGKGSRAALQAEVAGEKSRLWHVRPA